MWFQSWETIWRTLFVGSASYLFLVVLLRISGKRTLSKLNAFDFIVTVALGSTLATILLSEQTEFIEGAVALSALVALQFLITWLSVRVSYFRTYITSQPTLLFLHGAFLQERMQAQRVTESELYAAMRLRGFSSTAEVAAVVLETDGTLSVLGHASKAGDTTLKFVDQLGKSFPE